ncbi:hypothetical protein [Streptomyces sp. NPDC001401]|uniref:hypothetical protein n=1 Tax=Streptomyces sp. NPDC001401 TaxID=3364570 RepID=UPI00369851A6
MIVDVEVHHPGIGKPVQSGAHQHGLDAQGLGGRAEWELNGANGSGLTPINCEIDKESRHDRAVGDLPRSEHPRQRPVTQGDMFHSPSLHFFVTLLSLISFCGRCPSGHSGRLNGPDTPQHPQASAVGSATSGVRLPDSVPQAAGLLIPLLRNHMPDTAPAAAVSRVSPPTLLEPMARGGSPSVQGEADALGGARWTKQPLAR